MLALPIFPGRLQPSIVSRNELNYCVRNGNRWTLTLISTNFMLSGLTGKQTNYKLFIAHCQEEFGDPYRIRTDVKGVRGLCLNHLTNGPFSFIVSHKYPCEITVVHHQGLEPWTPWLRVRCSTSWANGAYHSDVFRLHLQNRTKKRMEGRPLPA